MQNSSMFCACLPFVVACMGTASKGDTTPVRPDDAGQNGWHTYVLGSGESQLHILERQGDICDKFMQSPYVDTSTGERKLPINTEIRGDIRIYASYLGRGPMVQLATAETPPLTSFQRDDSVQGTSVELDGASSTWTPAPDGFDGVFVHSLWTANTLKVTGLSSNGVRKSCDSSIDMRGFREAYAKVMSDAGMAIDE